MLFLLPFLFLVLLLQALLQEFLQFNCMVAGNVVDPAKDDLNVQWTFESSFGLKRRIDYILCDARWIPLSYSES